MPRTDENGKGLKAVLSYELDYTVTSKDIYSTLGISRSTYHNRINEDDFPNAEECRLLAVRLGLNPLDLCVRFGLFTHDDVNGYQVGPTAARNASMKPRTVKPRGRKLSPADRRRDVPKL